MSYTIDLEQNFFPEVHKVVDSQTQKALNSLHTLNEEEAIHDVRKRCKKIRAAWRLIRDSLGESQYKRRNRYYRDIARLISDLRDATTVIEALDLLENKFGDTVYKSTFSEMRSALQERRDDAYAHQEDKLPTLEKVEKRLQKGLKQVNPLSLSFKEWKPVIKSLTRTYGRGYDLCKKMQKQPSSEGIHQWRKRSKYIRYELRLLKKVWPEMINPWRNNLNELSDWQGDHHDMLELKKVMARQKDVAPLTRSTLDALATQYQEYCYVQSRHLGKRLFAEKPKHFAKRMHKYLKEWEPEPQRPVSIEVAFE
ncbi:MAG TPA: CHAD domain-containing protein [Saprospiraceae bacterium]|nr:CHAD domain-containing protein [Saprospiraceae bacterium]